MTGKQKTTTTTKPAATRTRTRVARHAVGSAPDTVDNGAAAPATPAHDEPAPRPAPRRKPSTTATPAAVTPPAEPDPQRPAAHNPDAKPGEQHPGEATFKLTANVPVSLHQRAAGVVRYAEMTGEPEEILSLTDLVRNALAELVTHYEKKYNEGGPVPHSEAAPPGPAVTELLANAQLTP